MPKQPVVFTIRKAFGDDRYSWCVFQNGAPVMCGLLRREAQYHRDRLREEAGVK